MSVIAVDNSAQGAIYKGLAVTDGSSNNRLFAANFGQNRIDAWDNRFQAITPPGLFSVPDGTIPKNYAPFNIQNLNGTFYVAYAQLSGIPGEELSGPGIGYLASFDLNGKLLNVWEGKGLLNAPWGLAIAPSDFGEFRDALLVANFGDGTIVGYDRTTRTQLGYLLDPSGNPIKIDGLWGLTFGNGVSLGEADHLYFTAGPNDESDGLFGKLQAVPNLYPHIAWCRSGRFGAPRSPSDRADTMTPPGGRQRLPWRGSDNERCSPATNRSTNQEGHSIIRPDEHAII